ncbi:MAG: recombinase family protein [Firmicutes bacterium]|nr:recombinase family protein [Bacillota bacterium]
MEEAQKRGYDPVLVVAEQASGINDKRRGLWRILRLAEKHGFDVLLIESPDRLARFGYRYLTEYLRTFDGRVEPVQEQPPASFEEELTRDLITILTVFSARLYGRRSRGFRKKITDTIHAHHEKGGEHTVGQSDQNPDSASP